MTVLSHIGLVVAVVSFAALTVLVVLGARRLRREAREAELQPPPRHYADSGLDILHSYPHVDEIPDEYRNLTWLTSDGEPVDVPGPGAQPQQTTRGPGHHPYCGHDITDMDE